MRLLRRRRRRLSLGAALVLAPLGGCGSELARAVQALPPRPTIASVALSDYRFAHRPAIRSGRAVFRAHNQGRLAHEVILVRLPADLPGTFEDQLRGGTRRPVETIYRSAVGPGESAVFAADLAPGRYGFVCFVQDPDGATHALKGMSSDLRVGPVTSGDHGRPEQGSVRREGAWR